MFDLSPQGGEGFQAKFPALFEVTPSPLEEITAIAKKCAHHVHDLDFDGEAFYEASHYFESITKANLLQRALVKGYFYAAFETAELTFKGKSGFNDIYRLEEAAFKYEVFIHQGEKFMSDADLGDIFTQKVADALKEAHFKLSLIYGNQGNMAKAAHYMAQAAEYGHEQAETLLPQIASAA